MSIEIEVVAAGPPGPRGYTGNTGPTGPQGAKGDKGDTGNTGAKGDKGDTGPQGAKGDKGDTGNTGAKGDKGDTGNTGAKGDKGDKGDTGNTGAKGDKGDTGAKGDKGDTGNTGAKGDKGDQGDQGVIGPTPSLSIGTVGTGAAAASLTGTSEAPVLNLTLPSAGANGVNTAAIQDSAVTSAKIADGTIATADIADAAVTVAKLGADVRIGNLLTANQATPTTTGAFTLSNCTEGAAGVFTSTATGTYYAYAASLNTITAGETYTATITLSPTGRAVNLLVEWRNSGGSSISSAGTAASATARTHRLTLTAPTGAVSARVYAYGPGTGSIGDTVTVTKVGLWKGASGQWALPGQPILGLTDAPVGNLLTRNTASIEQDATGFFSYQSPTLTQVAAGVEGTYALQAVCTGTGGVEVLALGGTYSSAAGWQFSAIPGQTYTFRFSAWTTVGTRGCAARIVFRDASGTALLDASAPYTADGGSAVVRSITATAPAGTAYAEPMMKLAAGSINDAIRADCFSFHRGAGGVFSLPGLPVVGQSSIAVNGAVHLSGTGSPEGVVTAAPGSTWLQTDATTDVKGWIRWVKATGTGNTGWVAGAEADTGLRDVSSLIPAAHLALNPNAKMTLRRVGPLVTATYYSGTSPTATGLQNLSDGTTIPTGFRWTRWTANRVLSGALVDAASGAGTTVSLYMSSVYGIASGSQVSGTRYQGSISWTTDDAWPSSLPGSAA
jgi:hypothetical protein